jgi:hypothetical protein
MNPQIYGLLLSHYFESRVHTLVPALGSILIAGLVEAATIMLVGLYANLWWDILPWLDAEDVVLLLQCAIL